MKECLTNGGNKLTGNHPTSDTMLHIKVQLPVLLCAVKTVEGDFRFCWTITPNVGQTHKENPNLVRILYMVCTLNDIHVYTNSTTNETNIDTQKNKLTSLCRGQKTGSKCIRLVFEILVICRALQALYTPQRCELMKTTTTTKKNNTNCSYRIFIVCRSPVSPVFLGPDSSDLLISAQAQFVHTNFAITR